MKLSVHDNKMTEDMLRKILIVEEVEGEKINVRIKKSSFSLKKGEPNITLEIDTEDEEEKEHIREFFGVGPKAFMSSDQSLKEVHMTVSSIKPGGDYLLARPVLVLTKMRIFAKQGSEEIETDIGPGSLPDMANFFGFMSLPVMQPPASLVVALQNKDEVALKDVCNSIKSQKSLYGKHTFVPKFYVTPGLYADDSERELKWYIQ